MLPISHRFVESNGIRLHVAECGEGPVVLLCHGFPELWYSWRHQLQALARAGFRAIAPDMRGYGQSDRPTSVDDYTVLHLVGDLVGLLDAIGAETAPIVGHDWGAAVAWHATLLRPDRFPAIVALSVPFRLRSLVKPTSVMPADESHLFYQLYFQPPGIAEHALEQDVRLTMRSILWSASGYGPQGKDPASGIDRIAMVPRHGSFLTHLTSPDVLPHWLGEADVDYYTSEFARTGFAGGLNWYRNIDRNWELLGAFSGARVRVPALYIGGDRDLVVTLPKMHKVIANLGEVVPQLRGTILLPGCGHWTQQERPTEVNQAMVDFLKTL